MTHDAARITERSTGLSKSARWRSTRIGFGIIGALIGFASWFLVVAVLLLFIASMALGGPHGDWSTIPLWMASFCVLGTLGFAVWLKSKQQKPLVTPGLRRLLGVVLLLAAAVVLVPYPDAKANRSLHLLAAGILGAGGLGVFLTWRRTAASNP